MADTHLLSRNGTWYYRRKVPDHLVAQVGRKMIQHSLETKDKAKAIKLREIKDLEWSAYFAVAAQGGALPKAIFGSGSPAATNTGLTQDQWLDIVRIYVKETERRFGEEETLHPATKSERAEAVADIEYAISILRNPDDFRSDEIVSDKAARLLKQAGIEPATVPHSDIPVLGEILRRGILELNRRKLARYEDRFDRDSFDSLFSSAKPKSVPFKSLAGQYLKQEIEEAEANGMSPKWTDKITARVQLVRELIGDSTVVANIDYDFCLRARSLLARTPSHRNKLYPGLTLEKAIEKGAAAGKPVLAPLTQSVHLDALRDILQLAVLKGLLANNPAQTLRPLKRDDVDAKDKRLPFTQDQIKAIFTSDFYQRCAPNSATPYTKKDREWRFWLPLLCLFMGLRPIEACQMLPGDVKCTPNGTWYVDIVTSGEEEDGNNGKKGLAKTLKTATSRRKVPVHPELMALGFIEFAMGKQNAKAERLLADLRPDKYGNLATYALKRFRETFFKEAITLEPRQTFYSFRHSFRDALRRSEAGPEVLKALGGWSQGALASDAYGDNSDPDLYVGAIGKVSFPGLVLSHLYVVGGKQ